MKLYKLFTVSLLLLPTMAFAQQPSAPALNTEVSLKLTLQETEMVWAGLRKLPVETVEQVMGKIRQQVTEQTQPKPVDDKKESSPPK